MNLALPSALALTLLAAPAGSDLTTLAAASPRPQACGGWPVPEDTTGRWHRARRAAEGTACSALARGHTLLRSDPERALAIADSLSSTPAVRVEARVLSARALARMERHAEAWQRFAEVKQAAPAALESPGTLRDIGVAAARAGHHAEALTALRTLLPRVSLLDEPADGVRVHVEAAALAMLDGPNALGEAIAYLSRARMTSTAPELDEVVLGMLALALDRAGRVEESRAVVQSVSGPWRLEALADPDPTAGHPVTLPFLPRGEFHAVLAILAERVNAELAATQWKAFIEARGDGAFVQHAERHLQGKRPR